MRSWRKAETSGALESWLAGATKGIPAKAAATMRAEIIAHHRDALDDYRAQGYTDDDAQRAAMADPGDEHVVARALRDTHLARRRYRRALLAGLAFPLILPSLVATMGQTMGDVAFSLFHLLPTLYLLRSFNLLLAERYGFYGARWAIRVLSAGLAGMAIAPLAARLLWQQPLPAVAGTPAALILNRIGAVGLTLFAAGFLFLGEQLAELGHSLHGLLRPIRYAALVCGFSLAFSVGALALGKYALMLVPVIVTVVSYVVVGALLTWLFFRALSRPMAPPAETF